MSFNSVTSLPTSGVWSLAPTYYLDASHNYLTSLPSQGWPHNLANLDVSHNSLQELPAGEWPVPPRATGTAHASGEAGDGEPEEVDADSREAAEALREAYKQEADSLGSGS